MSRIGKVKSWSDEKGFGFILPQDQGQDIFVHRKVIGMQSSLVPGKEVRYDYALDKGKPQATSVHGEGVIKRSGFGNKGADYQVGIIKSWLTEKGYGFIAQGADGTGPDLFVLNKQANGALDKGVKVTYTLGVNPKTQKQWAENVTPYPMFDQQSAFNPMAQYGASPYADQGFYASAWPQPNPYSSLPFY